MKRKLQTLIIALVIGAGSVAFAVEQAPVAVDDKAAAPDANATSEAVAETSGDIEPGSNEDLQIRVEELTEAIAQLRAASPSEKRIALVGLLGAIAWLLFGLLKRTGTITDKGRKWIPLVAVGIGGLAGIFDAYVIGGSWLQALLTAGGPPLSVLFQALLGLLKSKDS